MNFIVGSPSIKEGGELHETLLEYVLYKYREKLDEQAKVIEQIEKDGDEELEVLADEVIFILLKDKGGLQFVELGTVINRKYQKRETKLINQQF